jgi:hypothetical protein
MTLELVVKKPLSQLVKYLTEPALFAAVHPAIYKIETIEGGRYRFFERFDLGFIPYKFSYTGTIVTKSASQIEMKATVFGLVYIDLLFDLRETETGTLVKETAVFRSVLPLGFIMAPVFKKVHRQLFAHIEQHDL